MQPLVSVIIPVYNVKPYLREALDSVINQTYRNLEIIIVDDGSTDGSGKICDQYQKKDNRIRVIHQQNKGLSGARNAGLDVMHGEIVSFLDPDDVFLPNMIEIMMKSMIKTKVEMAICGYYSCVTANKLNINDLDNIFIFKKGVFPSKYVLNRLLARKLNYGVWNKIYHRGLFENQRFPDGYVYEDQIVMPCLIERANNVTIIEKPLLIYRNHRVGSITTNLSENNFLDYLNALKFKDTFVRTRTPSIFSFKDANQFQEQFFIEIILYYMKFFSYPPLTNVKTRNMVEQELNRRAKNMHFNSIRVKTIYSLYKVSPRLCYCVKQGYSAVKKHLNRLLRNVHG